MFEALRTNEDKGKEGTESADQLVVNNEQLSNSDMEISGVMMDKDDRNEEVVISEFSSFIQVDKLDKLYDLAKNVSCCAKTATFFGNYLLSYFSYCSLAFVVNKSLTSAFVSTINRQQNPTKLYLDSKML